MKLPRLSSKEVCTFLEKEGFVSIRQKGSHRFYRHSDGRTTLVPIILIKILVEGFLRAYLKK